MRDYLDGWAIDVEHGFGLVERAKIALAFGLPILAAGVVLSLLWAVIASVVAMLGRWWRGWRVHWRRLVRDDLLIEVEAVAVIASFQPMTATA